MLHLKQYIFASKWQKQNKQYEKLTLKIDINFNSYESSIETKLRNYSFSAKNNNYDDPAYEEKLLLT